MEQWGIIGYIVNYFNLFVPAAVMTLEVTAAGILVGVVLGFIFSLLRLSRYKILNILAKAYIWIIRGTPLLLQLWLIYYGLAEYLLIDMFPAAFLALGIHNGAYIAEIFRGAIQSIDLGQREAGASLGMTKWKVMHRIVLPQAIKRAIPSLGNQFIIALKDSSLASTIAVKELLLTSKQLGSSTFRTLEMLSVAAVYYLLMTSILTVVISAVERRLNKSSRRT